MKNKSSFALILTGTVLILSALFLCLYNISEDRKSGEKAQNVLEQLKNDITPVVNSQENNFQKETEIFEQIQSGNAILSDAFSDTSQQVNNREVQGINYVGFITLPSLNLELPVAGELNESVMSWAPCVYNGSAPTGDLIIAAHNYSSHFRNIDSLVCGDTVYYTDVDGNVYEYQVTNTEIISGTDAQAMVAGSQDSWDLSLFTCTLDGRNRITVRAVQVENLSE
ncbi:MAG: sortase [Oscillospiraceae bacterium]|nr:sortase [Oscillospiraceae bacterium]